MRVDPAVQVTILPPTMNILISQLAQYTQQLPSPYYTTMFMQVLSNSVATALKMYGGEEAEETAIMAETFNNVFECLNVSCYTAGKHQRNKFKEPYRSKDDFR